MVGRTLIWFFGHRYGDFKNFTGRTAELKMLADWLNNDKGQPAGASRTWGDLVNPFCHGNGSTTTLIARYGIWWSGGRSMKRNLASGESC